MVDQLNPGNYSTRFRAGDAISTGGLPLISTNVDSVRAYQFEIIFEFPTGVATASIAAGAAAGGAAGAINSFAGLVNDSQSLSLAAKKVGAVGFKTGSIKTYRVNDLVFYPGLPETEPVKITFDNLYAQKSSQALWNWFKKANYDPLTGNVSPIRPAFKARKMTILELGSDRTPIGAIELYGVYPANVMFSERAYQNNEFQQLEVDFQYDYMDYERKVTI